MSERDCHGWGIYLPESMSWAILPPRMCKPTPHNCDLVGELINLLRDYDNRGVECELKRIPPKQLAAMRAERQRQADAPAHHDEQKPPF